MVLGHPILGKQTSAYIAEFWFAIGLLVVRTKTLNIKYPQSKT